jgi:mannose-6-phosphate isomerase-like protein (cupin superfamily)
MKKLILLSLLALAFLPLTAQETETVPSGFQLWTTSSLQQLSQELSAKAATDAHYAATHRFPDFSNDYALFARREADGIPEWHETEADIFFVKTGTATLLVGGTLEGAQNTEPNERRNGTIVGGIQRKLAAGDVVRIPAKTPHQLLLEGAHEFTYLVIKIKGY